MPEKKVNPCLKTIATELLDLFGADGEHWMIEEYEDGNGNYCLMGGLGKIGKYNQFDLLNQAIGEFDPEHNPKASCVEGWNDTHDWYHVKKFLMELAHPYQPTKEKSK